MRRRTVIMTAAAALLVGVAIALHPFALGLSLVVRAADLRGVSRHVADLATVSESERLLYLPIHPVATLARVYVPSRWSRQAVLLVSGLHPAGIDEPRLVALARELAKSNVTVLTPEIPELSRFEITPAITDRIEQVAVWLATESGFAPSGRIGMMGVSFSGGLSIVAAGRPALRDRLLYVFSFGGHDDLPRVLGYFCTGDYVADSEPQSVPHDYGVAIALLAVADHLVPSDQLSTFREAVRRFLWASYVDRFDKVQAQHEFAALRAIASTLPQPSATLLEYVNDRNVTQLGRRLLPYVAMHARAAELSPARSMAPTAPVFLLHGADDNVIPAAESRYLADRLRVHGNVRLLVTDLISHADADQPAHLMDVIKLAGFWGDLLTR
jgi:pimeloyl-ACP methyl ester carboxylesterase